MPACALRYIRAMQTTPRLKLLLLNTKTLVTIQRHQWLDPFNTSCQQWRSAPSNWPSDWTRMLLNMTRMASNKRVYLWHQGTLVQQSFKVHHGTQSTFNKTLNVVDRRVLDSSKYIRVKGRIDFIRQLPVEIVMTRLIPLLMHNADLDSSIPCAYVHVSQLWCDRIAQCFGGLHFNIHWEED